MNLTGLLTFLENILLAFLRLVFSKNSNLKNPHQGNQLYSSVEAQSLYEDDLLPPSKRPLIVVGETIWACVLAATFLSLIV